MEIAVRRAGPSDAEAIWKCYTAPLAVRNTLQMPYRSLESVREQLAKYGEGDHILVAAIDDEVVGVIGPAYVFEAASQSQRRDRDDGSRRLAWQRRRHGDDAGGD